mmetsp:Transcript_47043/g.106037  ORF Transcript_47043/g.106037 Transcript_47043/m.106037 type:complete len:210 (+) Transcript_47043:819-1448(+)
MTSLLPLVSDGGGVLLRRRRRAVGKQWAGVSAISSLSLERSVCGASQQPQQERLPQASPPLAWYSSLLVRPSSLLSLESRCSLLECSASLQAFRCCGCSFISLANIMATARSLDLGELASCALTPLWLTKCTEPMWQPWRGESPFGGLVGLNSLAVPPAIPVQLTQVRLIVWRCHAWLTAHGIVQPPFAHGHGPSRASRHVGQTSNVLQ